MWFKYTHCAKNSPRFLFLRLSLVWLFAICITMYGKIEINKWHVYLIIYPRKNIKELNLTGLLTHGQTSISICRVFNSWMLREFFTINKVFYEPLKKQIRCEHWRVCQSLHFRSHSRTTSGYSDALLPVSQLLHFRSSYWQNN